VEEQDELEIETRLRAALRARSELVTHSTLRPGIPPNEHTAGVRSGGRGAWWSWRRMWVPVTVAAALAGGVFVGAQLPSGSTDKSQVSAGGQGGAQGVTSSPTGPADKGGSPSPSLGGTSTPASAQAQGAAANVGTLDFTLADGWQLTAINGTSGCVTLKAHAAPVPAAAGSASLPCGVDALYLKTDAATDAWPLSTATNDTGWWPGSVSSASDIACPTAQSGSGASNTVKDSTALRSSAKYTLAEQTTADYHEWAVTCDTGSGVRPMLWKLNASPGAATPAKFAVATVVSADPAYDSVLLGMVGSLHQAS
jgi:hypothetical protein